MLPRQQLERGLPAARVQREADGGAEQDHVAHRVGDRDDLADQRRASSWCRYGAISAIQAGSASPTVRIEAVDQPAAIACRRCGAARAAAARPSSPGTSRRTARRPATGTGPRRRAAAGSCTCRGRRARTAPEPAASSIHGSRARRAGGGGCRRRSRAPARARAGSSARAAGAADRGAAVRRSRSEIGLPGGRATSEGHGPDSRLGALALEPVPPRR